MNTKDRIIQEIETASPDVRKEVLDFILFLKSKENQSNDAEEDKVTTQSAVPQFAVAPSIVYPEKSVEEQSQHSNSNAWDILENMSGTISAPEDWSQEHDHYLYGSTKRRDLNEER